MATVRYIGGSLGGKTEFIRDRDLLPLLRVPVLLDNPRIGHLTEASAPPEAPRLSYGADEYRLEPRDKDGIYTYRYVRPDLERKNAELRQELSMSEQRAAARSADLEEALQNAEVDTEEIESLNARIADLHDAIKVLAGEL